MNQSFEAIKPPVPISTERRPESIKAVFTQEIKTGAEAAVLRQLLENVCRITARVISPYLTDHERQEAILQLARWRQDAEKIVNIRTSGAELLAEYQAQVKQIDDLGRFIVDADCGYPKTTREYPGGMTEVEAAIEWIKELRENLSRLTIR